jgi:hypothetical protein
MNEKNLNNLESLESKQLVLKITGAVEQSNLAEFEKQALAVISSINTVLETDEQFAEAEANVKFCQQIEIRIATARSTALASTEAIAKLIATTERLEAKFRETRLSLNSKVKTEKERRKNEIINAGRNRMQGMLINSPVKHCFVFNHAVFTEASKGKRNLAKIQEAVDELIEAEELRLANMEADFADNMAMIEQSETEWPGLFPDKQNLALSAKETVLALIQGRVADHRLKVAEKARKEQEEADRKAAIVQPPPELEQTCYQGPPEPPELPIVPPILRNYTLSVRSSLTLQRLVFAVQTIHGIQYVIGQEV